jgi:hypothetical protein
VFLPFFGLFLGFYIDFQYFKPQKAVLRVFFDALRFFVPFSLNFQPFFVFIRFPFWLMFFLCCEWLCLRYSFLSEVEDKLPQKKVWEH